MVNDTLLIKPAGGLRPIEYSLHLPGSSVAFNRLGDQSADFPGSGNFAALGLTLNIMVSHHARRTSVIGRDRGDPGNYPAYVFPLRVKLAAPNPLSPISPEFIAND